MEHVDVFRYHEISESSHRILNPLSERSVDVLGEICDVGEGTRILDLACGKAEMLCRYASRLGASGLGIDVHPTTLAAARHRAVELGVDDRVLLVEGDASRHADVGDDYDVVACIGATWIGGGLTGTLAIMSRYAARDAWFLVGEIYWATAPSASLEQSMAEDSSEGYADLTGTLARIEAAGYELDEMVLASAEDWDRYATSQWRNVANWLRANPDSPEAPSLREQLDDSRRTYLAERRGCMGWGVFAMRRRA